MSSKDSLDIFDTSVITSSNFSPTTILQVALLAATYSLYWGYKVLARPVQLSEPFLIQNVLLIGSGAALVTVIVIQIVVCKNTILNQQYFAWILLVIFALFSLLWARDPMMGFQHLKFYLFMIVAGLMTVNSITAERMKYFWVYYLLIFSLSTLCLGVFLGLNYGSLRAAPFGGNTNTTFVLTSFTAIPVALHFYYHPRSRIMKKAAMATIGTGLVVLVFSESRVSLIFITVLISGLLIFNHDHSLGWSHSRLVAGITSLLGVISLTLILVLEPDLLGRVYTVTIKELSSITGPLQADDPIRVQIYKFSTYLLRDVQTYVSGVGYHNFGVEFGSFTRGANKVPHNAFLKPLVEMGIIGFFLFAIVVIYPIKYALSAVRMSTKTSEQSLAVGLLWSYVGVLVFALFQPISGAPHIHLLSAILFGVVISRTRRLD
jgi:O-antigen ligase